MKYVPGEAGTPSEKAVLLQVCPQTKVSVKLSSALRRNGIIHGPPGLFGYKGKLSDVW